MSERVSEESECTLGNSSEQLRAAESVARNVFKRTGDERQYSSEEAYRVYRVYTEYRLQLTAI